MNRTALITGGAQRLGRAMVEFLAGKGWNVIVHANINVRKAEELAYWLRGLYPDQHFSVVQYDLINWKDAGRFIKQVNTDYGPIDLLINNASKYSAGSLTGTDADLLEEMTAIHYFSPLMMGKQLAVCGCAALIINILDAAIVKGKTANSAYLLAKKSLVEMTKMAAIEWAPALRVNGIAPGPVLPVEGKSHEEFNRVVNQTPLQKPVELKALNASVDYLIENVNVTGQILFCDSGQHLI